MIPRMPSPFVSFYFCDYGCVIVVWTERPRLELLVSAVSMKRSLTRLTLHWAQCNTNLSDEAVSFLHSGLSLMSSKACVTERDRKTSTTLLAWATCHHQSDWNVLWLQFWDFPCR